MLNYDVNQDFNYKIKIKYARYGDNMIDKSGINASSHMKPSSNWLDLGIFNLISAPEK